MQSQSSDPKRRITSLLKRSGRVTTEAVASLLQVSDVAARQHLSGLESQGLVSRETAPPSGRGRPRVWWRLTEMANDLFPDRHDAIAVDLIDGIRSALGEEGLNAVIDARGERQLRAMRRVVPTDAPLRERLEALADQRTAEGYMAEVQDAEDGSLLLLEHHCPICDAAKACQLFCTSELDLFRELLGPAVEVQREQHLIAGDERCVYRVMPRR